MTSNIPRAQQRSASYPSNSLEACIEMVSTLFSRFSTSVQMTRENIATALGKKSGTIQMITSSAVQYGLLEKEQGQGYRVSHRFVNIHKPLTGEERQKAIIDCFCHPKLNADLIKDFEGKVLPDVVGLATQLYRNHSISEPVSQKAAEVFIETARYVGVLNEYGVFSMKQTMSRPEAEIPQGQDVSNTNTAIIVQSSIQEEEEEAEERRTSRKDNRQNRESGEFDTFQVRLKGNRMATLILPRDSDIKDFDVIINWARLNKDSLYET